MSSSEMTFIAFISNFVQTIWPEALSLSLLKLWEDSETLLYFVWTAAIVQELLQADHPVLVEVHAGEHLLHVLRLHFGVNLRPHQVVDGVCNLRDVLNLNISSNNKRLSPKSNNDADWLATALLS